MMIIVVELTTETYITWMRQCQLATTTQASPIRPSPPSPSFHASSLHSSLHRSISPSLLLTLSVHTPPPSPQVRHTPSLDLKLYFHINVSIQSGSHTHHIVVHIPI